MSALMSHSNFCLISPLICAKTVQSSLCPLLRGLLSSVLVLFPCIHLDFGFFPLLLMFHYLFYHQPKESVSPFVSQLASRVWVLTLHNMTNRQIIDNANIN